MGFRSVVVPLLFLRTVCSADASIPELQLQPVGAELPKLPTVDATGGKIALKLGAVRLVGAAANITTRCFNSSLPSATIAVYPGSKLSIELTNGLTAPSGPAGHNTFHHPNATNLHLHGMHVSPLAPADDVLETVLRPQMSHLYEYDILAGHSPGTYWYHPHHHGSQVMQTGAGAVGAVVVLDPPGFLSTQLASLEDRVLIIHDFRQATLAKAATKSHDELYGWTGTGGTSDLWLVNGAPQPQLTMRPGEWYRLRLVVAAVSDWIHLKFDGCQTALLAKDGIYINDFPRFVSHVTIPPGGRADVVVRCSSGHDGERVRHDIISESIATKKKPYAGTLFHILTEGPLVAAGPATEELRAWSPPWRPAYLQDVTSVTRPGCTCTTTMGIGGNSKWINGHLYSGAASYMHRSPTDAVIQRLIKGVSKHSYHQHSWPFQLAEGPYGDDTYFKTGDWHDTYLNAWNDSVLVRYTTADFHGPLVLHCHALSHSDGGMIAVEQVGPGPDSEACGCNMLDSATEHALAASLAPHATQEQSSMLVFMAGVGVIFMVGAIMVGACHVSRSWRKEVTDVTYSALAPGPISTSAVIPA